MMGSDPGSDPMKVRRSVIDAIGEHARREAPNECCGLLIGVSDEIVEAVAARNVADDPRRRYEVSPAEHFAQIKRCREESVASGSGRQVLGVYHSHPHSAPVPSPTDRELAFSEFLFVIAGPVESSAPLEMRAYRLNEGTFEDVRLEAIPDPPA